MKKGSGQAGEGQMEGRRETFCKKAMETPERAPTNCATTHGKVPATEGFLDFLSNVNSWYFRSGRD